MFREFLSLPEEIFQDTSEEGNLPAWGSANGDCLSGWWKGWDLGYVFLDIGVLSLV